nr:hypothetical protein [Angustibacter aerolatus]
MSTPRADDQRIRDHVTRLGEPAPADRPGVRRLLDAGRRGGARPVRRRAGVHGAGRDGGRAQRARARRAAAGQQRRRPHVRQRRVEPAGGAARGAARHPRRAPRAAAGAGRPRHRQPEGAAARGAGAPARPARGDPPALLPDRRRHRALGDHRVPVDERVAGRDGRARAARDRRRRHQGPGARPLRVLPVERDAPGAVRGALAVAVHLARFLRSRTFGPVGANGAEQRTDSGAVLVQARAGGPHRAPRARHRARRVAACCGRSARGWRCRRTRCGRSARRPSATASGRRVSRRWPPDPTPRRRPSAPAGTAAGRAARAPARPR